MEGFSQHESCFTLISAGWKQLAGWLSCFPENNSRHLDSWVGQREYLYICTYYTQLEVREGGNYIIRTACIVVFADTKYRASDG